MRITFLMAIVGLSAFLFIGGRDNCSLAQISSNWGPERLVIIKGKATIMNHPDLGVTPFSGGTIIFQKVGCNSCYVAAKADIDGNFKISGMSHLLLKPGQVSLLSKK